MEQWTIFVLVLNVKYTGLQKSWCGIVTHFEPKLHTFNVLRRWPRKLLRRYGRCSDIIAHVSHLLPLDILGSISIVSWSGYCSWVPDTRSAYSGFCHHRTCIRECKGLGTSVHHARVKYRHSSSLHKKKSRKQNRNYHSLQIFLRFHWPRAHRVTCK